MTSRREKLVAQREAFSRKSVARAFGRAVKERRAQLGVTQLEIARGCNFDRTYPSLLERGLRTPTLTIILEIAQALQLPAPELVASVVDQLADDPGSSG